MLVGAVPCLFALLLRSSSMLVSAHPLGAITAAPHRYIDKRAATPDEPGVTPPPSSPTDTPITADGTVYGAPMNLANADGATSVPYPAEGIGTELYELVLDGTFGRDVYALENEKKYAEEGGYCAIEGTFGCVAAYDGFPTTIFKCGAKHEDVYRGAQGPLEQPNLKLRWQRGEECPGTCHAAGADGKGAECRAA